MNKIESFEQFLATNSAQFSAWNFMLNLMLTALLAYLLSLLYNKYANSLSNRKNFSSNFMMLAITTMIIITIVKSSLALSLGLVGALSIVRFRAAIKEPEELTYLFLNIAIGLGFGADQKLASLIGFVFVASILIGKHFFFKTTSQEYQNLIVTLSTQAPVKDKMNSIIEILKEYCVRVDLRRFDENDSMLETSFVIEIDDYKQINNAKNKLQEKFSNISISFIDNNLSI